MITETCEDVSFNVKLKAILMKKCFCFFPLEGPFAEMEIDVTLIILLLSKTARNVQDEAI